MKITKLALNDILYELVSDITIDNTLTTNQDSVPSTALVKTNIDRIDNSVSEVNTQLSTIRSNLSSLQTSVSELNAKQYMNTINLSRTDSLGDAIKQIKNSSFIAVIFNRSLDNPFLSYGFDSGVLCLYYWRGYWDEHTLFLVFGDKNKMATGIIEQSTNTITNIYTFDGANAS